MIALIYNTLNYDQGKDIIQWIVKMGIRVRFRTRAVKGSLEVYELGHGYCS